MALRREKLGSFEVAPTIRVYVGFDLPDLVVNEIDILTTDLYLSEPYEDYK